LIFGLCLVGMKFDPLRGSDVFALSVTFCCYNNTTTTNNNYNSSGNNHKSVKGALAATPTSTSPIRNCQGA